MEAGKFASIETSGGSPLLQSPPEPPGPSWVIRATWLFVGLGIAVRLVRYLVNYPIWHDEAFLAVNFWDRSYVDLLRPLDYGQIRLALFGDRTDGGNVVGLLGAGPSPVSDDL